MLAAAVMDLLDATITQTASRAIRRELGGSFATLEWISAACTLAMSVTLLVGSRLGDILGRRRVLCAGLAGFVATSALCALAPTSEALIAARALQGAVAAIMVPQGFGLIRELFGDEGQQKAFAVFGPVMGLAAVAGPLVGGGLVNLDVLGTGWRAIFLVNVPLGLAALAAGRRFLPRTPPATPEARPDARSAGHDRRGGARLAADPGPRARLAGVVVRAAGSRRAHARGIRQAVGAAVTQWSRAAHDGGGAGARRPRPGRGRWRRERVAAGGSVRGHRLGDGMVFVPMFDVILAGVAPHELGSASGLLESVQQLAMSLGIAAVGTVLFHRLGSRHGPAAFVSAADHGLWVAIA
ncbi:MAG: MFS transporter [Solirubrobacteraceae bacterium]